MAIAGGREGSGFDDDCFRETETATIGPKCFHVAVTVDP